MLPLKGGPVTQQRATFRGVLCLVLVLGCCAIYAPSKPGEPPQFCTVFNHMVKSGGTSIKQQLVHSSKREGDAHPGLCTSDDTTTLKQCTDALHKSPVIMGYGELLRHPLEKIGRQCDYFTVMRHPISRLVSAFYFCPAGPEPQSRPAKWCGNQESPLPTSERLVDFALKSRWGYMAYGEMMFGIYCSKRFELCEPEFQIKEKLHGIDTEMGREAVTKMEEMLSAYTAVGIFEEWELSMQLFNATVKSSVRDWDSKLSLNHGVEPEERAELLEWAYLSPEINTAVAADMMLYAYSLSLFRHQTSIVLGKEW